MKNKFYVFTTNNYRLLMHVMLAVMAISFIGFCVFFIVTEEFIAAIAIAGAAALTCVGSLLSERLTLLGDYILLTEDGISYRHIGNEKMYIAYSEAEAKIAPSSMMRGQRYKSPLVIGIKGSLPASTDLVLRNNSLADGWFFCAYDKKLLAALEERIGTIAASDENDTAADTGVIDGEGKPAPTVDKSRFARRRKLDDTHDDDNGDGSGWRCD